MKKHTISVSSHDLTRCSHCARHQQIDRTLDDSELLALRCHFCHEILITSTLTSAPTNSAKFGRSSKLAIGLLSASLSFTACEKSSEDGSNGGEQVQAGEMAGVDIVPAGDDLAQPEYGAPAPIEAGTEAGSMAGEMPVELDMSPSPDFAEPMYGGIPAGEMAGSEAGSTAGNEAGTTAGNEAGVEMVPAGDFMPAPEYGAPPAGSEG